MGNREIVESIHIPVMLEEIIREMHIEKNMNVIDATLGGGSYTRAFHQIVMQSGRVVAIDRDLTAIKRFKQFYPDLSDEITFVHENYSQIKNICEKLIIKPDRIIADFGLSSDQLKENDRGFSFLSDDLIDMRMDTSTGEPASIIVNECSEKELLRILRVYGDENRANRIVTAIIKSRPILTTGELSEIIVKATKGFKTNIHPATKTFQSLRIVVNDEYQEIETFLKNSIDILSIGGYLGVVSFHSGEDRIVKNIFKEYARTCKCSENAPVCMCDGKNSVEIQIKNGIIPTEEEIKSNPRSRSARLRVVKKIN